MTNDMNMRLNGMSGLSGMNIGGYGCEASPSDKA